MGDAALTEHLRDAIRLNRARRADYRRRGGLRADLLSRALVAAERALLPAAWWLDREAARYDVPVLRPALADMAEAPSPDQPLCDLPRTDHASPLRPALSSARSALWRDDLDQAAAALVRAEWALRHTEQTHQRHGALARHLLESAARFAEVGADAARQSGGATRGLSRRIVLGHLALLPLSRVLDRLAAPVHARGVGLFVHDVPPIPAP